MTSGFVWGSVMAGIAYLSYLAIRLLEVGAIAV